MLRVRDSGYSGGARQFSRYMILRNAQRRTAPRMTKRTDFNPYISTTLLIQRFKSLALAAKRPIACTLRENSCQTTQMDLKSQRVFLISRHFRQGIRVLLHCSLHRQPLTCIVSPQYILLSHTILAVLTSFFSNTSAAAATRRTSPSWSRTATRLALSTLTG